MNLRGIVSSYFGAGELGKDRNVVAVTAIVLLALFIRLAYVLTLEPAVVWSDGQDYSRLAVGLLRNGAYVDAQGRPSAFWPPGYPLLLVVIYALFGESVTAVRVVQCLIGAATTAAIYHIARRLMSRSSSRVAALISALYPLFIYTPGAILAVSLLIALTAGHLLGALITVERRSMKAATLAGLLGGWLALTAATALPTLLLTASWIAWESARATGPRVGRAVRPRRGQAFALAATYLLPIVAIVGAWTVRNDLALGHPVVGSTNGGFNLWLGNYPGVTAATGNRMVVPGMEDEARRVWLGGRDEVSWDREFRRRGLEFIAADPARFLRLSLSKAIELWALYPRPMTANRPNSSVEKPGSILSYGLLLPFAFVWSVRSLGRRRASLLILSMCVVHTLVHAFVLSKVRYRLPLDSFVIIYGAGGAVAFARVLRRGWIALEARSPARRRVEPSHA